MVVALGETETLPFGPLTVPTFWSIDQEVALVVAQFSVELCPASIDEGDAVNDEIAGPFCDTVTVAVALAVPPGPFAVAV